MRPTKDCDFLMWTAALSFWLFVWYDGNFYDQHDKDTKQTNSCLSNLRDSSVKFRIGMLKSAQSLNKSVWIAMLMPSLQIWFSRLTRLTRYLTRWFPKWTNLLTVLGSATMRLVSLKWSRTFRWNPRGKVIVQNPGNKRTISICWHNLNSVPYSSEFEFFRDVFLKQNVVCYIEGVSTFPLGVPKNNWHTILACV